MSVDISDDLWIQRSSELSKGRIDIRYHFVRSALNNGKIIIKYCPTDSMVADIMTKAMTKFKIEKMRGVTGQCVELQT